MSYVCVWVFKCVNQLVSPRIVAIVGWFEHVRGDSAHHACSLGAGQREVTIAQGSHHK